jgi:hypothetical protein
MGPIKVYWYSAKTAVDWLLCHHALKGRHFAWFAPEFDTYRKSNPESSNPHVLYHGYMAAWRDSDDFAACVTMKRISLCNALEKNVDAGLLGIAEADELKETIERADISLFYPLVYRINFDAIEPSRRKTAVGSGAKGSEECLIVDLQEQEFELLFAHFREDPELKTMILDSHGSGDYTERYALMDLVERRLTKV